jgi:hypothetical protein
MKTLEDIPEGSVLTCRLESAFETSFVFVDAGNSPIIEIAGLDITRRSSWGADPLYEWTNIEAGDGWGPFVTDVAMEWITQKGGWLYPHRGSITPGAKRMWTIYFNGKRRPDIMYQQMNDDEVKEMGVIHAEPELRCVYRKLSTTKIDALRAAGMWDDQTDRGCQSAPP